MPTIKGKPISAIIDELKNAQVKVDTRDYDNMPYISHDNYRSCLDQIVGTEHYNEKYVDEKIHVARDTICIAVKGILELVDDDGKVCLVKEIYGGENLIFPKDKNTNLELTVANNFPNELTTACHDAFKKNCKKLGIGVVALERAKDGEAVKLTLMYNANYSNAARGYFTDAYINDQPCRLAVFSNQLTDFQKVVVPGTQAGAYCMIQGKFGTDKRGNKQFIFSKFAS